jgi:hypothetical protein
MQFELDKRLYVIAIVLLGCCTAAAAGDPSRAGGAQSVTATAQPAEWQTFDVLVDFQNLPRTYSCDELWYKFRDVLIQLGARTYGTISPYDCGTSHGGEARSPHVEVAFQLPRVLHGAAARYAQISVIDSSVRLTPGSPRSLGAYDCEFMKQLHDLFFPALPLRIETAEFNCAAAPPSYTLVLSAPVVRPASRAPAASAPHS